MTEPEFANSIADSPICRDLFHAIRLLVKPGGKILELGSGRGSTPALAKLYDLRSVEHKPNFVGTYNNPENYYHIPLAELSFYSRDLIKAIDFKYELLLVDGPDEENRPYAFLQNCDLFDKSVPWVFDDYGYKDNWRHDMHMTSEKTGKEIIVFNGCKPFCVLL